MQDNFLRGAPPMLLATVLFSISDTMAKFVTETVPPVELASIRYGVFVLLAGAPFLRNRRLSMRSRRPLLQVVRGVGVVGSALAFVVSLGTLPIAEATAVNFVTPLLITVLAIPVLGEAVRPQGWAAVGLGFLGMLIVVRPGLGGFHPAAGLVLLSSLLWSVAMLVTRRLAGVDRTEVTLLWTAATGLALLGAMLPFFLRPMSPGLFGLCLLVGVVASGGQWLSLLAYRQARASAMAPLTYAQLLWSSVLGWAVFGSVPDGWTLAGAAVIAGSGIYVLQLERRRVAGKG